jgi:hypothetical protein
MPARVIPLWDSGKSQLIYSGDGEDSGELIWSIVDCPTSGEAYTVLIDGDGFLWDGLDGNIDGLLCRTIDMNPDGPNAWQAVAQYGEPKLKTREKEKLNAVGEYRVSFSVKPQTIKQFTAVRTMAYPASAKNYGGVAVSGGTSPTSAAYNGGAINVNQDGQVEGVDTIIPGLSITVTQRMAGASLTPAYALEVADLIGKYNSDIFMGVFPAGSIQFIGGDAALSFAINNPIAGGPPLDPQDRELSFEFLYSPNLTGITIGTITGINKLGHQYMWIDWESAIVSSRAVRRPLAVYVQDLFGIEPASFAPLTLTV